MSAATGPPPTAPSSLGQFDAALLKQPHVLALFVGVAALYFAAGKVGLSLAFLNASATPVWPPTGIALAALILIGRPLWPAILVGAFLVNITTTGSLLSSLGISIGNTLEALAGAVLVERYAGGRDAFTRPDTVLRYTFCAGMLGPAISASVGVATLLAFAFAPLDSAGVLWLTWWLGDFGGAVIVAPLLILWATQPTIRWRPVVVLETVGIFAGIWIIGHAVFAGWLPFRGAPVMYLCVPFLAWAAFRFGPRETATATAVLAGVAIMGTVEGHGPFANPSENAALLYLQGFLVVIGPTVLALAAGVATHRDSQVALRRAHDQLEHRVEERTRELQATITELKQADAALRQARDEMEQRVADRTKELAAVNTSLHEKIHDLEAFEQAVVGRELKMIALEKELAELKQRLGVSPGDDR